MCLFCFRVACVGIFTIPISADINDMYERKLPEIQKSCFERTSWPRDEEAELFFKGGTWRLFFG